VHFHLCVFYNNIYLAVWGIFRVDYGSECCVIGSSLSESTLTAKFGFPLRSQEAKSRQ